MTLWMLLVACLPPVLMDTAAVPTPGDSGSDSADTASDSGEDTADSATDTSTDTGTDTGSDTGDTGLDTGKDTSDTSVDSGDPCGDGSGLCALRVLDVVLVTDDPADPHTIAATPNGPGHVDVVVQHYANGCCPDVEVTAVADLRTDTITATIALTNDVCDCTAALGVSFTLTEIPSGTYTLSDTVATTSVTVE